MKQASNYQSALARGRRGPCRSGDAACAPRAPSFASKHRHRRPHHRACAANVTVDGTRCFYKKMHACIVTTVACNHRCSRDAHTSLCGVSADV